MKAPRDNDGKFVVIIYKGANRASGFHYNGKNVKNSKARQRRGDTEFLALQRTLPPAHKHIYAYESTAEFLHFSFQFRDLTDVGLIYFDSDIIHFCSNLAFTM